MANPDGRALSLGPPAAMSLLDTSGDGAVPAAGARDAIGRSYGSYAPYDVGKVLVAGGGSIGEDGLSGVPTRDRGRGRLELAGPVARPTASMAFRRRQHNLTVLADGSVLATGGMSTNGGGGLVDLANAVYAAERWDPATGQWTTLASAAVARQYHSTALLLPDGTVLTGGGGICGVCQSVGYLRRDFEVFTPPYLFRHDGSGALAPRPQVTGAPATIGYDQAFSVSSPQAASIRKLAIVRLGAPTHGDDQSQRYVPLTFSASGTTLTVNGPANPNEAPAGHYMLFAVDAAGVPSVAPIVSVQRPAAPTSPGAPIPVNLALNRPATGSTPCAATEGPEKAVNGSVSGGYADKWCTLASSKTLRVDLGSSKTVSRFVVKHASAGGENAALNTRAFRIETSTNGSSWTRRVDVTANTAGVSTHTITARSARYVRLVITKPTQLDDPAARIYELEVYGTATTPGPPAQDAPLVLYADTGLAGRAQPFQAGAYDTVRGNLAQIGNDQARSLSVAPGYSATICKDTAFAGGCTILTGQQPTLPAGYDRMISSLRVVRTG